MVFSEQDIKKKNLLASIEFLDSELSIKTRDLNGVVLFIDDYNRNKAAFELEKSNFELYRRGTEEELAKKRNDAHAYVLQSELSVENTNKELTTIEVRIKDKARDLAKLNSQCIAAEKDIESIVEKKIEAQRQLDYLTDLVVNVEETNAALIELTNKKNDLEIEIHNLSEASKEELRLKKIELGDMTADLENKRSR